MAATRYIIEHEFNVSRTEQYIDKLLTEQELAAPQKGRLRMMVKDVRLFLNTIDRAVGTMQSCGVRADVQREENENGLRLTISIPHARGE